MLHATASTYLNSPRSTAEACRAAVTEGPKPHSGESMVQYTFHGRLLFTEPAADATLFADVHRSFVEKCAVPSAGMDFMMTTTVLVGRQLRETEPCHVAAMRGRVSSFGTFDRKLTSSPYCQSAIETKGGAKREDGGTLFQARLTSAYYTRTEPVRLSIHPQTLKRGTCFRIFALTIMSLTQQGSEAGMRWRKLFVSMRQAITDERTGMKGISW